MNRINKLFNENKNRKLLSLYFCAGCPTLEGTGNVILTLQERGIDMIEVGYHSAILLPMVLSYRVQERWL